VGPIKPLSNGGAKFFVTFIDEHTNYVQAVPICQKSEVFGEFVKYQRKAESEQNADIFAFQTDGGGEYCFNEFEDYLRACSILHQKSCPRTPEQDGL